MPELDFDNRRPKAKAYGVILAGLIAVVSFVLVAITHDPKSAVSSPGPARAALVPQIASAKSEAEILFRGKSFAVYKRNIVTYFGGDVTEINVKEGQTVNEGDILGSYSLDLGSLIQVHAVLYPAQVLNLKKAVYDTEIGLDKLINVNLPLHNLRIDKAKKDLADARELKAKNMASEEAVVAREREMTTLNKQLQEIKDSIKQARHTLEKGKEDLRFAEDKQKRDLDLLEWQTNRSYTDKKVPLEKAFFKSPVTGQVIWLSPAFQVNAEVPKGLHVMTVAPMNEVVVRCKVHELDLVKLKTGDRGTVSFDAVPDKEFVCKVTRIPWASRNPALEVPADYEIECALENPNYALKEGLTCNVKVTVAD